MALPKEKFQVFISHATDEDGVLAVWLAEALDRLHIRAYVYERYPRGGQNRFEVIQTMIKSCPYFLVILTRVGISSQWVNQEIGYAVAEGKQMVPVVEVDKAGKLIKSRGFVELNDPIKYHKGMEIFLMGSILYTFVALLMDSNQWRDTYFVSCKCGHDFEGPLKFEQAWDKWRKNPIQFLVSWTCESCNESVSMSFPDCHIV